jgi:WXXGXW repeat (2 copies)
MTQTSQVVPFAPHPKRRGFALGAVALVAGFALSGCIVVPSGRYPNQGPQPGAYPTGPEGDVVSVAPPAHQVEVIVQAPGPGHFWIAGHWVWHLGRHLWIGGRWEAHRPGYHWTPHSWSRHSNGWRSNHGHWQRR